MSSLVAILALTLAAAPDAVAGGDAAPPDAPPADADIVAAESATPARTVRIRAHAPDRRRPVRVEMRGPGTSPRILCTSELPVAPARRAGVSRRPFAARRWGDCVADVPVGTELAIVLGDVKPAHAFVVPDSPGSELDLRVSRESNVGAIAGGGTLIGVGALTAFVGLLGIALYGGSGYFHDESATKTSTRVLLGGVIIAGGGAGLLAYGLQTRETRVDSKLVEPSSPAQSRRETLVGDAAHASPRKPEAGGAAPFIPLSYAFQF